MTFFIAEVSSNHSKDINRCYEFIDKAAEIGCDSIKFQLFRIDKLFSPEAIRHKPFIEERRQWELPISFLPLLAERCQKKNIQFSCSPFYLSAVQELAPYVSFYKLASYVLLWDDLLRACARIGKPVILSTGMATLKEVEHAVQIIKENGCDDITVLHCTSAYPTPAHEANLAVLDTLRKELSCRVGWSDHTVQPGVIYRSIFRWHAEVIEFHFDLEGKGAEYASGHCWLPDEIGPIIKQVRVGFDADGSAIKKPSALEIEERKWRTDPRDGLRPLIEIREHL